MLGHQHTAATSTHAVDGSVLEGGGQILRNCVAYAALTGANLEIYNIRAKRVSGGGLKAQVSKMPWRHANVIINKALALVRSANSCKYVPGGAHRRRKRLMSLSFRAGRARCIR